MLKITDYGFLFNKGFGSGKLTSIGSFQLSNLNSSEVQNALKAAGIDTSSKQYKAVMKEMMKNANGAMYTNIQAIKNLMKQYNSDGDWVDPTTGLTGLLVTDETGDSYKHIIDIPESSRQEMFDSTLREFIRENGVANGDTTNRSQVYTNMYWKMDKDDRLAAGYTMDKYERAYRNAMFAAVRKADPNWKIGMPIPKGALDGVTREAVEKNLVKSGNTLISKSDSQASVPASTQSSGIYSKSSIKSVEDKFYENMKNNPPSFVEREEKPVELSDAVLTEKMKRLEQQLKDGTFNAQKTDDELDMKV